MRNNGQKRTLNIRKRALNIQSGWGGGGVRTLLTLSDRPLSHLLIKPDDNDNPTVKLSVSI